jgi:hypothetical protein
MENPCIVAEKSRTVQTIVIWQPNRTIHWGRGELTQLGKEQLKEDHEKHKSPNSFIQRAQGRQGNMPGQKMGT